MDTTFDQTPNESGEEEAPTRELRDFSFEEILDELKLRFVCCAFVAIKFPDGEQSRSEEVNPDDDCSVLVRMYADTAQAFGMAELLRVKTIDLHGL